jgi:hypothetical protein
MAPTYAESLLAANQSYFAEINILGAGFCDAFKFMALYLGNGKVKYAFRDRWDGFK